MSLEATSIWVAPGFEGVAAAFEANFAEHRELGAAFAAYVDGEPVVDLWGGIADRSCSAPWSADTLVGIFSGSKGLVAACIAVLVDRKMLDLEAPICSYWPEFAAQGKGGILVRDLVCHQAGMPGLLTPVSLEEAEDDVRMARLLAEQSPLSPPGSELRYHAVTFGWLCGELIRRVDGRSVGRFLADEIAAPLGLEVWIGLPESEERRVAVIEGDEAFTAEMEEFVCDRDVDEVAWSIWANPPRFSEGQLAANLRSWRAAEVPATNAVVAARSLARLYGCLARGGELDGVRLFSAETAALVGRRLASGSDPVVGAELAYGVGFRVQTDERQLGPPADAFGHGGAGGSVHGAWPSLRTGFSYTPNMLGADAAVDPRAEALLEALHAAVEK